MLFAASLARWKRLLYGLSEAAACSRQRGQRVPGTRIGHRGDHHRRHRSPGGPSTRRYRSTLTWPLCPVGRPESATSSGAFTPPAQTNTPPSTNCPSVSRKPSSVAAAIVALVRTWTPRSERILAALSISCGEGQGQDGRARLDKLHGGPVGRQAVGAGYLGQPRAAPLRPSISQSGGCPKQCWVPPPQPLAWQHPACGNWPPPMPMAVGGIPIAHASLQIHRQYQWPALGVHAHRPPGVRCATTAQCGCASHDQVPNPPTWRPCGHC